MTDTVGVRVGSIVRVDREEMRSRDWRVMQIHISELGAVRAVVFEPVSGPDDVQAIRDMRTFERVVTLLKY